MINADTSIAEAELGGAEISKPSKRHMAKVTMVLSPGCMAIGFSVTNASQVYSLL